MLFLDEMELYMNEATGYDFYPVDFDPSNGVSFFAAKNGTEFAAVTVKTIDGNTLDATADDHEYADVYVDVEFDGDTDNPKFEDELEWLIAKLDSMGYGVNDLQINGKPFPAPSAQKPGFADADEVNLDIGSVEDDASPEDDANSEDDTNPETDSDESEDDSEESSDRSIKKFVRKVEDDEDEEEDEKSEKQ